MRTGKNALVCFLLSLSASTRAHALTHTVGMYSKAAWGGPVDPFILTVFPNDTVKAGEDPIVSVIIFEWKDQDLIGAFPNPEAFTVCAMDINYAGCVLIATLERADMQQRQRRS